MESGKKRNNIVYNTRIRFSKYGWKVNMHIYSKRMEGLEKPILKSPNKIN